MKNSTLVLFAAACFGGSVVMSSASDGVIEITAIPFVISQPGSYVLTESMTNNSTETAIKVGADDVVINLNGFHLVGMGGVSSGIGISQNTTRENLTVRNGSLTHFGIGQSGLAGAIVLSGNGNSILDIGAYGNRYGISSGEESKVIGCTTSSNTQTGIVGGDNSTISRCAAYSNGLYGIEIKQSSNLSQSTAAWNGGGGIIAGSYSTIDECTACYNEGDGFSAGENCIVSKCMAYTNDVHGIVVSNATSVKQCVARGNGSVGINLLDGCSAADCSVSANGSYGIRAVNGSSIDACVADDNYYGIYVNGDSCRIADNHCCGNTYYGVRLDTSSRANRVEGNHLVDNRRGVYESGLNNVVIKNFAHGNTTANYTSSGVGTVFPISSSETASSIPWTNFEL